MDHNAAYSRNRGVPHFAMVSLGSTTACLKDRTESVGIRYAGWTRFGCALRTPGNGPSSYRENCITIAVSR